MILLSNLYDANRNLWRNKLRSILTILAIMVGSFAIIISLAIQTGTKSFIDDEFNALGGDNVIAIYPKTSVDTMENLLSNEPVEYTEQDGSSVLGNITKEQIEQVKKITGIKASSVKPYVSLNVDYVTSSQTKKKYHLYVDALASDSFNIPLEAGSKLDQNSKENQIILLPEFVKKLGFENAESAVGQTVTIAIAQPQTVVTTPEETTTEETTTEEAETSENADATQQENNSASTNAESTEQTEQTVQPTQPTTQSKFTELKATIVGVRKDSMLSYSAGSALINDVLATKIQAENDKSIPAEQRDKTFALQAEHEDGANVEQIKADLDKIKLSGSTKTEVVEETHSFLDILTIILYVFGGIALLVAAIGIINTLLMSVQERTKEIGLNKALGMSSFRIFSIFSLESILLGFWGSAIGTLAAYGVGKIADQFLHREGQLLANFPDFHLVKFTILNIVIVIAIVMVIAFIAGTLPAIRAARKDPIKSLRHE